MRNLHHHHQQRLFLSLASLKCFIFLKALLLNAHLAQAEGAASCYDAASTSPTCPVFQNTTLFPFLTSQSCGSASSLVFSGCDTASSKPTWPDFINATIAGNDTLGPPFVMGFSNSFSPSSLQHNRSISSDANKSTVADPSFGFINLTWSAADDTLFHQNTCQSLASLSQISHDLPQSIDLTSFAHSSFQFSLSNIILLFNCTSLSSLFQYILQKNSTACRSYAKECGLQKKESSSCYQYTPESKKLINLLEAMKSLDCENAMFFVVSNLSIPVLQWSPRLIQLTWSTNNTSWMDSNYKSCELCLKSNGSCGYNDNDDFRCYCANHSDSNTICNPDVIRDSKPGRCQRILCNAYAKITIAGVAGAVIATAVVVIGIVACNYHKKTRSFFTKVVPFRSAKTSARQKLCGSSSLIIRHLDLDWLTERPIEYQYASIVSATKSFSNLLGEGGFGAVYKGTLGDAKDDAHVQIAVKVLEVRSKHSKDQFFNEVVSIGRIHHVHVVRLLGFCIEQNHEMLVYEYVINGSLDKWLFQCSDNQNRVLLWEQRYAIAIGMAKGLSYLHEECRHRIVHCDIKPQNILLDEQMRPKIADFGLARIMGREESRVVTLARGTPGYMGPEFWLGGESQLSTKLDVYSYGMVLLELISGQRNFGHGETYFPEIAFEAAMGGNFESIMDVKLDISETSDGECIISDSMQRQQVQTALLVALWCIQDHPRNRASMSEVVQYLEGTAAVNEQPPRPTIASHIISISAQQYLSNDLHYDITPLSGGR